MTTPRPKEKPFQLAMKEPFKHMAQAYLDAKWLPMPLPPKRKEEPPTGYTGWDNDPRKVNQAQVKKWISSSKKGSNVCHRPGHMYVGIDVDAYKAKGDAVYQDIIAEIGEFQDTWVSSSRDDGKSGIRHYRLPEGYDGMDWPGTVGEAIQFIHIGHRYAVLPPSMHPEGKPYQWYEPGALPDGNGNHEDFPTLSELPELSVNVIEYFTKGQFAKHLPKKNLGPKSKATKIVAAWIAERDGDPCAAMVRVVDSVVEDFEGAAAHDTGRSGFYRLACLSAEGHAGLATVTETVHGAFIAEVSRDDRDGTPRSPATAEAEWLRHRDDGVKKVMAREDRGEFVGFACTCTGLAPDGSAKPKVDVSDYYIPTALAACYRAVAASPTTDGYGIYQTGGVMRELTAASGLRDCDINNLRSYLAARVDWGTMRGGEIPRWVNAAPPKDFLASMLADSTIRTALPALNGLRSTPFWTLVDGKPAMISANGYNESAAVFLEMDPELQRSVVGVDLAPSPAYVLRAKELLHKVFKDFPFVSRADRAAAYAALILPFARDLVEGPTPLHLFEAPAAGTGKGLLIETIASIFCGTLDTSHGFHKIGVDDDRNRNVELTKSMTTSLRNFADVLVLDNVNNKLDSGSLASALTSYPMYQARLMGGNTNVVVPNKALWAITGNNLTASEEIRRRIVPCRIDSHLEHPELRRNLPDLGALVREERPALVWAVLTLIANWVAQGSPAGKEQMGSFESWTRVVGGILAANDLPGLLENRERFSKRATDDTATLDAMIDAWATLIGVGVKASAMDLAGLEASEEIVPEDAKARWQKLSHHLNAADGRVFGEYRVVKTIAQNKARYRLERADGKVEKKRLKVRGQRS